MGCTSCNKKKNIKLNKNFPISGEPKKFAIKGRWGKLFFFLLLLIIALTPIANIVLVVFFYIAVYGGINNNNGKTNKNKDTTE